MEIHKIYHFMLICFVGFNFFPAQNLGSIWQSHKLSLRQELCSVLQRKILSKHI